MKKPLIYKAEKEAGLVEKILASSSIAYASLATPGTAPANPPKLPTTASQHAKAGEQPDLFYLDTVLVSTGWNLNDDVFDRDQVWPARATSEDKQFNLEHNCADIIGHITGYKVKSGDEILAEDAVAEEIPEKFDIVTSAVLYRYWPNNEDLQNRMNSTIAEINKGEWFVSMECFFNDFDYALLKEGKERVVARNNDTAFLTKHLRAYGGEGEYQGYKVGRVLKNITFSGKGLVKRPANPDSVILSVSRHDKDNNLPLPGELDKAKGYVVAELVEKEKEVKKTAEELVTANAKATTFEQEVKTLKEANSALVSANKDVLEKLTQAESDCKAFQTEITGLKKDILKAKRESEIVKRLNIEPEQAVALVVGTLPLDDASFASHLDVLEKSFKPKEKEPAQEPVQEPVQTQATAADLNAVETEKPVVVIPASAGVDDVRQQVVAFLE